MYWLNCVINVCQCQCQYGSHPSRWRWKIALVWPGWQPRWGIPAQSIAQSSRWVAGSISGRPTLITIINLLTSLNINSPSTHFLLGVKFKTQCMDFKNCSSCLSCLANVKFGLNFHFVFKLWNLVNKFNLVEIVDLVEIVNLVATFKFCQSCEIWSILLNLIEFVNLVEILNLIIWI